MLTNHPSSDIRLCYLLIKRIHHHEGYSAMSAGKNKLRLADTISNVKRDFSKNLSTFLVFDIFFKIIATMILGPISAWIFNRMVASSRAWVIGNGQTISFVLSPHRNGGRHYFKHSGAGDHFCRASRHNFNRFSLQCRSANKSLSSVFTDAKISAFPNQVGTSVNHYWFTVSRAAGNYGGYYFLPVGCSA